MIAASNLPASRFTWIPDSWYYVDSWTPSQGWAGLGWFTGHNLAGLVSSSSGSAFWIYSWDAKAPALFDDREATLRAATFNLEGLPIG